MKTITAFFLLGAFVSSQAFANDFNLKCIATYNADKVLEKEVTLVAGTRGLSLGGVEGFEFFLSQVGENTVELQALNSDEQSRSYATAKINDATSFVELSLWKREFIMEIRCSMI